jgi:hypothetical protein
MSAADIATRDEWRANPSVTSVLDGRHITAPTKRKMASINARHIVMAFETAYT